MRLIWPDNAENSQECPNLGAGRWKQPQRQTGALFTFLSWHQRQPWPRMYVREKYNMTDKKKTFELLQVISFTVDKTVFAGKLHLDIDVVVHF